MPSTLFTSLTEEEKVFQPLLHTFLANADTQGLRNVVDQHSRETETVAKDLAVLREAFGNLREAFGNLQSQHNEDRQTTTELRGTIVKLQGGNAELRTSNGELQGKIEELKTINENLRDANAKLQRNSEKVTEQVNALEQTVEKLETAVDTSRTANQDLRTRLEQFGIGTQVLKDLQEQMRQCDTRVGHTESRQENAEEVLEKLADRINGPPPPPGLPQEAAQELYHDPYMQSNHNARKRRHAYDSDDEQASPQNGEESKRHARDSSQDDADPAPGPAKAPKQPPRLARQDAARAEGSATQQPRARNAPAIAQKQREADVSAGSDEVNPRWRAIKHHYTVSKQKYDASKPKNQRSFIWEFIEGTGDDEFCTWFQKHLLKVLPSDKVNRPAKKPRNAGDRIVALKGSLTWDEIRHVIRTMPPVPFLK